MFLVPLLIASGAFAFDVPPAPARFVHDGGNVLTADEQHALEEQVLDLEQRRGVQVAIATFDSLGGLPIVDASMQIAEAWRPGSEARDDGVLITLFIEDRELRLEVGYGLEERLPDATARRIIDERMVPLMKVGDPAGALGSAVGAIDEVLVDGSFQPVELTLWQWLRSLKPEELIGGFAAIVIFALVPLLLLIQLLRMLGFGLRFAYYRATRQPARLRALEAKWKKFAGSGRLGGGRSGSFGASSSFGSRSSSSSSSSSSRSSSFGGGSFGGGGASGRW